MHTSTASSTDPQEHVVRILVEQHEAGELGIANGPRYLTLSEQTALLEFAARKIKESEGAAPK